MAVTTHAAERSHVELEAAHRRAQRAERDAAKKLIESSFDDESYGKFMEAAEAVLIIRGQLHAGGTWTMDGGQARTTDWCNCTVKTESTPYQRFDDTGRMVAHGTVCSRCRYVDQTG